MPINPMPRNRQAPLPQLRLNNLPPPHLLVPINRCLALRVDFHVREVREGRDLHPLKEIGVGVGEAGGGG
jgi:hypothetical protein